MLNSKDLTEVDFAFPSVLNFDDFAELGLAFDFALDFDDLAVLGLVSALALDFGVLAEQAFDFTVVSGSSHDLAAVASFALFANLLLRRGDAASVGAAFRFGAMMVKDFGVKCFLEIIMKEVEKKTGSRVKVFSICRLFAIV